MVKSASSPLHRDHPRRWQSFRYVYPVISRRSGGLSVGINLNVHGLCNFDCIYCQVDRTDAPWHVAMDLGALHDELNAMLRIVASGQIWTAPPFDQTPRALRRLNDIAFSGDGEPTAYPDVHQAVTLAAELKAAHELDDVKLVMITNASLLSRSNVRRALVTLDHNRGEVWAKLDAGRRRDYEAINRSPVPYERILANLVQCGRVRPIVIQTMAMRINDRPPTDAFVEAYTRRLRSLVDQRCQIKQVQLYTVARQPTESFVASLSHEQLDGFADRVRAALPQLPVDVYDDQ